MIETIQSLEATESIEEVAISLILKFSFLSRISTESELYSTFSSQNSDFHT
jgi:hypothetical protein